MKYNNFDIVRLVLATVVFFVHTFDLTKSNSFSYFGLLSSDIAVKSFFVLSGYFIFRSYDRTPRLYCYLKKRVLRIYPAYFFSIVFFAFLLWFVSACRIDYFDSVWYRYVFYNLIFLNFLQPTLGCVFENQVSNAVNGALWTLKVEICFYLIVPVLFVFSKYINRYFLILLFYILSVFYVSYCLNVLENGPVLAHQFPGQFRFFAVGILFYLLENRFPCSYKPLIIVSIFAVGGLFSFEWLEPFFYAPFLFYVGYYIKLPQIVKFGDLSYGIYIFHFPLIQLFFNELIGAYPYVAFSKIAFLILFMSVISWRYIERPFLMGSQHYVK